MLAPEGEQDARGPVESQHRWVVAVTLQSDEPREPLPRQEGATGASKGANGLTLRQPIADPSRDDGLKGSRATLLRIVLVGRYRG